MQRRATVRVPAVDVEPKEGPADVDAIVTAIDGVIAGAPARRTRAASALTKPFEEPDLSSGGPKR